MKKLFIIYFVSTLVILMYGGVLWAQTFPVAVTDQTPTAPLANPTPGSFQPRYISGFGQDDSFTVFFEDRDAAYGISYAQTTTGPTGFPASATATNITDTHFLIKSWPINVDGMNYAYRAWGARGNSAKHNFYVSNDLAKWKLESTFTIPNVSPWDSPSPGGFVYYGFHDVILLNGTYYAWGESNQGQTLLVRSDNGDDVWEAFDSMGGTNAEWGPLQLPESGTPSGSFVDLGHDRGYGKVHVRGNDSGFYLAVNTKAKVSLSPADLEAAFINPANWTWHDGTVGLPTTPILAKTSEHDLRECWVVPNSDPDADWVIIYDADFGSADGGKALGYATLSPPPPQYVAIDIKPRHCPNKLKIKKKGKHDDDSSSGSDDSSGGKKRKGDCKVAILGTEDFDVRDIDIATIRLNGVVAPVKTKFKDVTAPSALPVGLPDCDCEKLPKDTYEDLELKFNSQEIIAILEPVLDGDIRELTLTGNLLDGTPIVGKDCVLIKGEK